MLFWKFCKQLGACKNRFFTVMLAGPLRRGGKRYELPRPSSLWRAPANLKKICKIVRNATRFKFRGKTRPKLVDLLVFSLFPKLKISVWFRSRSLSMALLASVPGQLRNSHDPSLIQSPFLLPNCYFER